MNFGWLVSVLLVGIGAIGSCWKLFATRRWSRATATVVQLGRECTIGDTSVNPTMRPHIRFLLPDGGVAFVPDVLCLGPLNVGDEVDILYPPNQPDRIQPLSAGKRFRVQILLALVGALVGACEFAGRFG